MNKIDQLNYVSICKNRGDIMKISDNLIEEIMLELEYWIKNLPDEDGAKAQQLYDRIIEEKSQQNCKA